MLLRINFFNGKFYENDIFYRTKCSYLHLLKTFKSIECMSWCIRTWYLLLTGRNSSLNYTLHVPIEAAGLVGHVDI